MTSDVSGRGLAGFVVVTLAGAILAGCYHGTARDVSPVQLRAEGGWTLVADVREVPQSSPHDCGIAALSTVLQHWGASAATPAELKREVARDDGNGSAGEHPGDEGVAAGELRELARRRGLRVFLIRARLDDLGHELGAGRPVLVGLKQSYSDRTLSHYEVVVGINPHTRRLLLFDPGHGPRQDGFDGFSAEWDPTGGLALVVTGWSGASPPRPFADHRGGP